ncbi:MAG: helix-turn-helix domain-containing protein [Rhodopseudomonas palustris]|nr:helix-turn-helix domain-containing protein [Rhodopseudomonas palustris]
MAAAKALGFEGVRGKAPAKGKAKAKAKPVKESNQENARKQQAVKKAVKAESPRRKGPGAVIMKIRVKKNLSQSELAKLINSKQSMVSAIETGQKGNRPCSCDQNCESARDRSGDASEDEITCAYSGACAVSVRSPFPHGTRPFFDPLCWRYMPSRVSFKKRLNR